ncbi:hypothetical protein K491DRAFT_689574 [Lophiostoma macrostomum CBS 122681]|uniref:MaoC-like domain-containing protein n=1 Tax=Lophiostoma macrostomum CBS 122681 TaxID=1314788 RepID=A0A6A6TG14_9PLEO|nr:hypothetical protein K491DRAFT_689574 [Lophiostoma macrostomum CBS 122681]
MASGWFSALRLEMLRRELPILAGEVSPSHQTELEAALSGFLPSTWSAKSFPSHLPIGHHLVSLNPHEPTNKLLPDGTDVLHSPGGPFVRRMWAGGSLTVHADSYYQPNGVVWRSNLTCVECITDVQLRGQDDNVKIFVTIKRAIAPTHRLVDRIRYDPKDSSRRRRNRARHTFRDTLRWDKDMAGASLVEQRQLVFLKKRSEQEMEAIRAGQLAPVKYLPSPGQPDFSHALTPTAALLFRYSALSFNAHAIHLDLEHARNVEGHRNLLVHGPLQLMLILKLVTGHIQSLPGPLQTIQSINYRNIAPLYCDEELRLCGRLHRSESTRSQDNVYDVWIEGPTGGVAFKGKVHTILQPSYKSPQRATSYSPIARALRRPGLTTMRPSFLADVSKRSFSHSACCNATKSQHWAETAAEHDVGTPLLDRGGSSIIRRHNSHKGSTVQMAAASVSLAQKLGHQGPSSLIRKIELEPRDVRSSSPTDRVAQNPSASRKQRRENSTRQTVEVRRVGAEANVRPDFVAPRVRRNFEPTEAGPQTQQGERLKPASPSSRHFDRSRRPPGRPDTGELIRTIRTPDPKLIRYHTHGITPTPNANQHLRSDPEMKDLRAADLPSQPPMTRTAKRRLRALTRNYPIIRKHNPVLDPYHETHDGTARSFPSQPPRRRPQQQAPLALAHRLLALKRLSDPPSPRIPRSRIPPNEVRITPPGADELELEWQSPVRKYKTYKTVPELHGLRGRRAVVTLTDEEEEVEEEHGKAEGEAEEGERGKAEGEGEDTVFSHTGVRYLKQSPVRGMFDGLESTRRNKLMGDALGGWRKELEDGQDGEGWGEKERDVEGREKEQGGR